MSPESLASLLAQDRLGEMQFAIVATLDRLIEGVRVAAHPGKVDVSELIAKTIVPAPGIGIGWSRIRRAAISDGAYNLGVEWTAYIVAEAAAIGMRRVEKERIGLAIGSRILAILADNREPFWGLRGVLPPEETPAPEFKPIFTVKDASQGVAYYAVTWTQTIADLGRGHFPAVDGKAYPDAGVIGYGSIEDLNSLLGFVPGEEVDPGA